MTEAEFPTLAEELKRHRPSMLRSYPARCRCKQEYTDWDEHLAAAWRQACTISTAEQLAALPIGSSIRELEHPVPGVFELQELDETDEPSTAWYVVGDGCPAEPRLPALLVWHPDWAQR